MNKAKTFRVDYQTEYSRGCIKVYVGNFISNVPLKTINALLKLARFNCTSEQQAALLMDLEEVKELVWTKTKRERIEKLIKKIKSQTWGKSC